MYQMYQKRGSFNEKKFRDFNFEKVGFETTFHAGKTKKKREHICYFQRKLFMLFFLLK